MPPVAERVMRLCDFARRNEAFAGDIEEEWNLGRSPSWLWRQILAMALVTVWADLRGHKLLAVRAIVVGLLVVMPLRALREEFGLHGWWIFWVWQLAMFALAGWVVARTHREFRPAMVLAFAGYVVFARAWLVVTHGVHFWSSASAWEMSRDLGLTALCVVACVAGGLVSGEEGPRSPGLRGRR